MLKKTQGTLSQKYYIKQEQKLERQYIRIQQKLGEYIEDPCPVHTKFSCQECTGWYGIKPYRTSKPGKKVYLMVKSGNGVKCKIK